MVSLVHMFRKRGVCVRKCVCEYVHMRETEREKTKADSIITSEVVVHRVGVK